MPVDTTATDDGSCPVILVVEDDRLLREMTVETLEAEELAAVGVGSGIDALTMLAACTTIKLLITDINMPGMSGFELLSIVEARYPALKLMAFSGRAFAGTGGLPAKTIFLAKPFRAQQLVSQVQLALPGASGTEEDAER